MSKKKRKLKHTLPYLLILQLIFIARYTPRKLGLFQFRMIALLASPLMKPYHKIIDQNLRETFGDSKTDKEFKQIKRGIFLNMGATLFDAIHLPYLPEEKFRKIVKYDVSALHEAQATGKGIIVLCAHMSCFELVPQLVSMDGVDSLTIGAPLFDDRVTNLVEKLRSRNGILYLDRNSAGRRLMKELKGGKLFGALIDQDATNDGVFAHFMGRLAFTPSGPIRLAHKFKYPLFFSMMNRNSDDTYTFTLREEPLLDSGDAVEDLCRGTESFNKFASEMIDKYPEQWVWMHRRWNRKREDHMKFPSITDYE